MAVARGLKSRCEEIEKWETEGEKSIVVVFVFFSFPVSSDRRPSWNDRRSLGVTSFLSKNLLLFSTIHECHSRHNKPKTSPFAVRKFINTPRDPKNSLKLHYASASHACSSRIYKVKNIAVAWSRNSSTELELPQAKKGKNCSPVLPTKQAKWDFDFQLSLCFALIEGVAGNWVCDQGMLQFLLHVQWTEVQQYHVHEELDQVWQGYWQ